MTMKSQSSDLLGDVDSRGIGSHQSAAALKEEWLTPPHVLKALGRFDLDPCAPIVRPWEIADRHFTIEDDGLKREWFGRVFCNPPYGAKTDVWLDRCASHGDAVALIFARTETEMFFRHVWERAHAVLFMRGRLHFHHADGRKAKANAGAPSVLVAYGEGNATDLRCSGISGYFVKLIP